MQTQKWKNQYVMFDLQKLNNDIWYWENTLSAPEKIVDFINNLDKESLSYSRIPQWKTWTASDNDNVVYGANKMIWKDSRKNSTGNEKIDQYTLYIINSLEMAAEFCYERYMDDHNLDKNKYILDLSHLPIRRWDESSKMGPHSDSSYSFPKLAYTVITYINDDYEGGEINFPENSIILKPKAGSSIMFPASIIQEVKTVISGHRYMSTNSINMI